MCTLIVLHRCLPGRPVVVAANRDEFLARPAEDFAIRETASGTILSLRQYNSGRFEPVKLLVDQLCSELLWAEQLQQQLGQLWP